MVCKSCGGRRLIAHRDEDYRHVIWKDCPECGDKPQATVAKVPMVLEGKSIDEWLRKHTEDGDTLKIHFLKNDMIAIQNLRTLICYFQSPKG